MAATVRLDADGGRHTKVIRLDAWKRHNNVNISHEDGRPLVTTWRQD